MLKSLAFAGLLNTALLGSVALAQSSGDAGPPAATPNPPAQAQLALPNDSAFVKQQAMDQWRAPKLVGVGVYGADGKKIGVIEDVLIDHDGNGQLVVIGVGGFLGFGIKDVAVPFKAMQWRTEPRAVATTAPPPASSFGPGGSAGVRPPTKTTDPAAAEAAQGYPDKAMLNVTLAQLKSAPDFQYAPSPVADLDAASPAAAGARGRRRRTPTDPQSRRNDGRPGGRSNSRRVPAPGFIQKMPMQLGKGDNGLFQSCAQRGPERKLRRPPPNSTKENQMKLRTPLIAIAITALSAVAQPALADANVKVGTLRCDVSAGLGLIITSSEEMSCVYTSTRGLSERYYGTIRKFGLDIGETGRGVLEWSVFAPTEGRRHGALTGDYAGVAASATVGAGVGANALVGGLDRSFTLQPLSVEVQSGLDLAAGVASMTLRAG